MVRREILPYIRELRRQFPAVLILGPRQCGKTTLAKEFLTGEYFDLEKPSDRQVFEGDIELAFRQLREPLIFDEAQTLPELFPVLRALIDEKRKKNGRYILLGSVNPALVRSISESLAGRVGIIELTPFLYREASKGRVSLERFWLRGGYPDAVKQRKETAWQRWMENYVLTLVERDIPRQGIRLPPLQLRRLLAMVAHCHGGLLNASDLGRSLGFSYHTVNEYLHLLEGHFLIRLLQPYYVNTKKRLVKAPKLYIRDSGLLHYLLGISTHRHLLEAPYRGRSWEGLLIQELLAAEQIAGTGAQFFFYRTHAGAEIDLILDRKTDRIGFEFKCSFSVSPGDWNQLACAVREGMIREGFLLYLGKREFSPAKGVFIKNALSFLK